MLQVETLPEDTQAELKRITSINPKDLTEYEAGFLRARRLYLRPEQAQIYMYVLKAKEPDEKKPEEK
jgi:hypothetical protein